MLETPPAVVLLPVIAAVRGAIRGRATTQAWGSHTIRAPAAIYVITVPLLQIRADSLGDKTSRYGVQCSCSEC